MDAQKISFGLFWIYAVTVFYCNCQEVTWTLTPVDPEVIEGNDVTFVCSVSGNASDIVNWHYARRRWNSYYLRLETHSVTSAMSFQGGNCAISPPSSFLSNNTLYAYDCNSTVYHVTVHKVQRTYYGGKWSCFPFGQSSGPISTMKILVPVISVAVTPVNTSIDIIEHTAGNITCQTSGTRPDALVTWHKDESGVTSAINHNITSRVTNDTFTVTTSILSFIPSREQTGTDIFCRASNIINTSPLESNKWKLNVLFPPEVQKMENITLVEGSTLDCNCPFTVGVPVDTSVQWIRDFDTSTWNDTRLVIQSVSREDGGKYMCKVSNTMHPTGETQPTPGESQELFHLEVQYETTLISFIVVGFTQTNVEVNENDRIHIVCTADGIPTPRISLRKKGEILTPAMTDRMDYILENTSCSDTGQYVCSAKNKHNTRGMLIKHIFLFVRCTPRANDAVVTERTTELESTVTFVFNALAYPYPTFTWWKLVKAEWKQLFNEENVIIQSSDFLSNLTIRKVFSTDFTYYKVIISNDIGTNEQIYELLQSEYQNDNGNNPDGGPFNIGSVIGYSVGATVGCFMLIMLSIVLVWIFRFRRAKTNNPTNQAIGMTKVEESASETGFRNSISDAHESNEPSTEGGAYYNEESFSRLTYETLDMENKVLSNYSTVDTTNQGHTDVDDPYVKMN